MPSSFARTFTTQPPVPVLDLDDGVGQRSATFRFDLVDRVTGYRTAIRPRRDTVPTLTHNTAGSIVRQLVNVNFDVDTSALVDVITSRIEPFMIISGDTAYPTGRPLGRYMFNSKLDFRFTSGTISATAMYDEGFEVDQQLGASFGAQSTVGIFARCETLLRDLLATLPIVLDIETSPYTATTAGWGAGTQRGYVVQQLALDGDWFPPWFGNDTKMHFIRTFDPATALVTFDLDAGNRVVRDKVIESTNLIDAPNRFVVISNSANAVTDDITGTYDVPSSAPHSIQNRGFVIPKIEDRQVDSIPQAQAVARNLGLRQTVFEQVELYTPPDPRHDSYDVLRWQGKNWLETSWSLPLVEGSEMQHVARRAYQP